MALLLRQLVPLLLVLAALVARAQISKPSAHDDAGRDGSNKFTQRQATDDLLGYSTLDEESLANSQCPVHLELRWQSEVSSSVYSSPLIADVNADGKLDIVVPTFVHYLEVLEGADGEKLSGWPVYHQSVVHSSPLLYDMDKDGSREILLPTYNGEILVFRSAGYLSGEKLAVPRLRVKKDWFVGLSPDHADRSHPDVHDDTLAQLGKRGGNEQKLVGNGTSDNATIDVPVRGNASSNSSGMHTMRRLQEESEQKQENQQVADDTFQDLADDYPYDYDDYSADGMWGDEEFREAIHEEVENYVDIDAHILCTPVIADIDADGVDELVVAASFFFDREYYEDPAHAKELGNVDISKYVAGAVVVFNLQTKEVKWKTHLDLSTDSVSFRAYIYSPPTVADLDGKGELSIIVGTSFGFVYALHANGTVRESFPLQMGEIQAQVVVADVNDDGKVELLTADTRGNVAAWTPQGKEIWEVHVKSLISQAPTLGDVDGDGKTDIVVPTVSGNIYVLRGADGVMLPHFPFRTHGRVMSSILLVPLSGESKPGLTLVATSFDGYLYLVDGATGCADAVDIGETSYSMVLADNVDGGDDLDLVVTTMNGNVYCFQTSVPHHPLKSWRAHAHGRNVMSSLYNRQGVFALPSSRTFRDEAGETFWLSFKIVDHLELNGPYNVTVTLHSPDNYRRSRKIMLSKVYDRPGVHNTRLPCLPTRTSAVLTIEMEDKHGFYFSDEFSLTFHMHYYRLLKWMVALPLLLTALSLALLPSPDRSLPSFSRD